MYKFGLIGHPIAHSLSPALFKAAFDGKYTYDLIEGDDFEQSYKKFLEGYQAINVTAPFKELAYRRADIATDECQAIGAANILLKRNDGKIVAANSDHLGVLGAARTGLYPDKTVRPVALIAGCGGAAKAAAYAMASVGYRTIIVNRSYEKAVDFAQKLGMTPGFNITAAPMSEFRRHFREAGIIVYTLPVRILELDTLSGNDIRGNTLWRKETKVIIEANYKDPAFSAEFIQNLEKKNPKLTYVSGKEWLLYQAIGAYASFLDEEANIEAMRKVL